MAWSSPTGQKLLLLFFAATLALQRSGTTAYGSGSSGNITMVRPGCPDHCGNVSTPYPFGTGKGCFQEESFEITCNMSGAYLATAGIRALDINLHQGEIRVQNPRISWGCNYTGGRNSSGGSDGVQLGPFLKVSDTKNKFTGIGCAMTAFFFGSSSINENKTRSAPSAATACSALCSGPDASSTGCSSVMGCCQNSITGNISYFETSSTTASNVFNSTSSPCSYAFLVEEDWFKFDPLYLSSINFARKYKDGVPLVLDWVVGSQNCSEASKIGSSYACQANSVCSDVYNGPGYRCNCSPGYQGNPYLEGGCQDINECHPPNKSMYPCQGECSNTDGSYTCSCLPGFRSDDPKSIPCVRVPAKLSTGLIVGLSVASGPCLLLLVLGAILITRKVKQRRAESLKQKFFNQNRGQLLQQLVSHRTDIAERMIIPLDELAKATNNFDQTRKLGGGGHGTVYKGILSDLHVVAIKKSKIVVQREIDEFINEVAILSQINHRNIVKLHGCCLETEVPLLAYEFISNGTLSDHLHKEPPTSISWQDRLRIACEMGKALAYLHSAASIPIVHRDMKSSNVLLDDALTAKVSDFGASRYIPIDKTGITTTVQGTNGYLDPMYYYTGRLTEKSDVYSFGVILVELLTRKKPFSYRSPNGDALVVHFVDFLTGCKLVEILDPQVAEEGGSEVEEVAALAASCVKLRGEERPTMRQVEMALEGVRASNDRAPKNCVGTTYTTTRTNLEEATRSYSLENEFLLSSNYPR